MYRYHRAIAHKQKSRRNERVGALIMRPKYPKPSKQFYSDRTRNESKTIEWKGEISKKCSRMEFITILRLDTMTREIIFDALLASAILLTRAHYLKSSTAMTTAIDCNCGGYSKHALGNTFLPHSSSLWDHFHVFTTTAAAMSSRRHYNFST